MPKLIGRGADRKETVIGSETGEVLARIPWSIRQQVRYFWTRLQVHDGELPRSVGVTSQLSGEGVSFTSRALAAVLARTGNTCLLETNWWSPGIFVEAPNPGLIGVMQGTSTLDEVLVKTDHRGLSIMPAGELSGPNQAVMANREAMAAVLNDLQGRFRYVVLDLPAITSSATALSFAAAADASLLVVRQRATRIDQVETAVDDLRHTRLLGVVLNRNHLSMPRFLQRRLLET